MNFLVVFRLITTVKDIQCGYIFRDIGYRVFKSI